MIAMKEIPEEIRKEIKASNTVKEFLGKFPSEKTKYTYRSAMISYFYVIDKDPDSYLKNIRKMENGDKIDTLDAYEEDITKYWRWLIEEKYKPKSISNYINVIKVFFKQHRIQFDDLVWDNIRKRGPGSKPTTIDRAPTNNELKEILSHSDTKGRALLLMLSSSGMRIGEALSLTEEDVDTKNKPTKVTIRKTKSKESRICFISDEATDALKVWLKERPAYLISAENRCSGLNKYKKKQGLKGAKKRVDDDRIFPFDYANANYMWTSLLDKAGLVEKDKETKRLVLHLHTLRKFFKGRFRKYDPDVAEKLMGHTGYLGGVYDKWTDKELAEEYQKGVTYLLIFQTPADTQRYDDEVAELKEVIAQQQKQIDSFPKLYMRGRGEVDTEEAKVLFQKKLEEQMQMMKKMQQEIEKLKKR
jgi:integrase